MRVYQIIAETYESKPYPVVIHTFLGETPKEARGYFKAHLGTCSFFNDCTKKRRFRGFRCETLVRSEGWIDV